MLPTPYVSCDYNKVYEPSEDSFLLLDALEKELPALQKKFASKLSVVCEVGCGSGIVTTFMMQNNIPNKYAIYIPTDINPWALESMTETAHKNMCLEPYLSPAKMDLASSLRPNQVDVLVFNPPYVPAEGVPNIPPENSNPNQWLDLALLGGDDGMVVTQRLLDDLDDILSPDGAAYILFCARNKPEQAAEVMRARGWKTELVEHRKAGWEVLSVYKFHR